MDDCIAGMRTNFARNGCLFSSFSFTLSLSIWVQWIGPVEAKVGIRSRTLAIRFLFVRFTLELRCMAGVITSQTIYLNRVSLDYIT